MGSIIRQVYIEQSLFEACVKASRRALALGKLHGWTDPTLRSKVVIRLARALSALCDTQDAVALLRGMEA